MNYQDLDKDILLSLRDSAIETLEDCNREIQRRWEKEVEKPRIKMATLSQLASKEEVTPQCVKARCRKFDIPIVDRHGNSSGPGKTAYVNTDVYYKKYGINKVHKNGKTPKGNTN